MINRLMLGTIIKQIRLEKKMTQRQVAGNYISVRHYINIEKDNVSPSIEILNYICTKLSVSIEDIFYQQYIVDYIKLENLENLIKDSYNNGELSTNLKQIEKNFHEIRNVNVINSINYKFSAIFIEYKKNSNEVEYIENLKKLIIDNPTITTNLEKKIHQKILVEYIQACSYSKDSINLVETSTIETNRVIIYVLNTSYIL